MSLSRAGKILTVYLILVGMSFVSGADWNQWRGPNRNGVAPGSPALTGEWGRRGPPEVWTTAEVPAEREGGFGSVSVVDGKAYVYSNWKYRVPTPTRILTKDALRRLGWEEQMPQDIREATEEARLSDERAALEKNEVRGWAARWVQENIPEEQSKWRGPCQRRLMLGEKAVPLHALKQLKEIADRQFPTQKALDEWFAEHGIEGGVREKIMKVIPDYEVRAKDVVLCFDAVTGETVWKTEMPGTAYDWACSCTPCVVDGRCYVLGSDTMAYCLDAATGETVWETKTDAPDSWQPSASFAVVDGVAVLSAGPLSGYDAATGELLWQQEELFCHHNSPTTWQTGGETLLICQTPKKTGCVDPTDGSLLWQIPAASSHATAAVQGNLMVVMGKDEEFGVKGFRISRQGAEELWSAPFTDRGSSPVIHGDAAYVVAAKPKPTVACLDLETGRVNWQKRVRKAHFSSPIVADGKLIAIADDALLLFEADPAECRLLGEARLGITQCTSPAIVDGLAYLRLDKSIGCFDLRAASGRVAEDTPR